MPTDLSLAELSALADVPVRTIRYYLAQGLLASPGREGPGTRYPVAALHRLRLIRQLQRGHLPLAEIRKRLAALTDHEVEALSGEAAGPPPADSALDYVRGVLRSVSPAAGSSAAGSSAAGSPAASSPSATPVPLARRSMSPTSPASTAGEGQVAEGTAPADDRAGDHAATSPPAPPPPLERSQWERIVLEPDVELHLRRPLSRLANKRVERVIAFARELLEEDQP